MGRRLHPTLADYAAIAINPVLVMGLVGSFIFLLLGAVLPEGSLSRSASVLSGDVRARHGADYADLG